jgi:hypothetical protein
MSGRSTPAEPTWASSCPADDLTYIFRMTPGASCCQLKGVLRALDIVMTCVVDTCM